MHSEDVMTKNAMKFLNTLNELSGKMAKDTKDDLFLEFMELLLIKQESLLGITKLKKFSGKSLPLDSPIF